MKALVLAGGAGTRLRPLTHTGAKQLVPVANRPVLFYVVDNLVDAGVVDIGVIVSPESSAEITRALGDGSAFGANFSYILQEKPAGLAHAVATARTYLGDDDFVMYLGDNLVGMKIREMVESFARDASLAGSVMLKEVPNPSAFGVAETDEKGEVVGLVEKPKEPKSNLALVGIYLFRKSIFDAIARIQPSARGELEITDAINRLILDGGRVRFTHLDKWWLDTGKKDDLLLANDTVLDDWLVSGVEGEVDAASVCTGRVRIGKGTRIERSVIRGPVIIGENAHICDARIEPFTAIGDGVTVVRSTVAHSVVMEKTSIVDIERVADSLIGKRVVLRQGSPRHHTLSLMIGDDCVVELSKE